MGAPVDIAITPQRAVFEELARRALFAKYRRDPLTWLEERFGEDRKSFVWSCWGGKYYEHIFDGTPDPLATAWQAVASGKWVGVESATGVGKTFFLSRLIYWFLDVYDDSLVVTSATSKDQLKTQLWAEINKSFHKFKRIRPHAALFDSLRLLPDARGFDETQEEDQNLRSWQAIAVVSKAGSGNSSNVGRQGFHRENMLIVVDEGASLDFASLEAYKNTSTGGNNVIIILGNPDNELDALHQFCISNNVEHIIASALDHPNLVLGSELVKGATTVQSVERRRVDYGETSNMFLSRVRGLAPKQAKDSLIKLEWIEKALVKEWEGSKLGACGVDVANSANGDKGAVAFMQGACIVYLKDFTCPDASHLAYNLLYDDLELAERGYQNYYIPTLKNYKVAPYRVGIDSVGVGTSTTNTLNNNLSEKVIGLQGGQLKDIIPTDNEGKPIYQFNNIRSQMIWELAQDFKNGKIFICTKDIDKATLSQLKKELVAPTFAIKEGKIVVESKDSIKKRLNGNSPNLADAVAYVNWVRKGYYAPKTSVYGSVELPIL